MAVNRTNKILLVRCGMYRNELTTRKFNAESSLLYSSLLYRNATHENSTQNKQHTSASNFKLGSLFRTHIWWNSQIRNYSVRLIHSTHFQLRIVHVHAWLYLCLNYHGIYKTFQTQVHSFYRLIPNNYWLWFDKNEWSAIFKKWTQQTNCNYIRVYIQLAQNQSIETRLVLQRTFYILMPCNNFNEPFITTAASLM